MTTPQLAPALGKQCAARVYHQLSSNWGEGQDCKVKAQYREGDKDWCGTHLLSRVLARVHKRAQEHEAFWEVQKAIRERHEAEHAAFAGIANPAAVPVVIAAARDASEAWESNDLSREHTQRIMGLMAALVLALAALDKS